VLARVFARVDAARSAHIHLPATNVGIIVTHVTVCAVVGAVDAGCDVANSVWKVSFAALAEDGIARVAINVVLAIATVARSAHVACEHVFSAVFTEIFVARATL
jgi:hypothetical protein